MGDSSFWRDIAKQFRVLAHAPGMLRAEWDYIVGSGGRGEWSLTGADGGLVIEFEVLARRAGAALSDVGSSALLIVWLEVLKNKSGKFQYGRSGTEPDADGTGEVEHLSGAILRVCEASAHYCSQLEGNALEAEFRADSIGHEINRLREECRTLEAEFRAKQQNPLPTLDPKLSEIQQFCADSIGHQINRLREECRMTVEELAEAMSLSPRTVQRHMAGVCAPLARNLFAYERVFSKALNKKVLIEKMS
jgi:DNA-binding transcriptional ArsR family regulator